MICFSKEASILGESRVIYPTATDFCDSLDNTVITVNGMSTIRANALSSLRISVGVGCSRVIVVVNTNLVSEYPDNSMGVRVDGVSQSLTVPPVSAAHFLTIAIDPGAAHVVEITPGWMAFGTHGTWIRAVSVVGGSAAVLPNPSVNRRLAVYGDSIAIGALATTIPSEGWVQRLRLAYPGRISLEGWGSNGLCSVSNVAATAERLVGLCFDASTREIWDELGYNDWYASRPLVEYKSTLESLYDAIHALAPDVRIWCQTPLITGAESTPNANGQLIGDFRTAKAAAAVGRSWVTIVDGVPLCSASHLQDGIHPTSAGHADIAANIASILGT